MFKLEPTYYQQEIWERSKDMSSAALFLEQGLGKTKIAIDTAYYLHQQKKIDAMIIITHKSVAENWHITEIPKHAWDGVGKVSVLWGYTKAAENALLQMKKSSDVFSILSVNIEALRSAKVQTLISQIMTARRVLLVIDESTIIKNSCLQQKAVMRLGKLAAYKRILSGEPAPNGPVDYYYQYKFLDDSILNLTKTQFERNLCELETLYLGFRQVTKPSKAFTPHGKIEFERKVAPYTFRLKKQDTTLTFPAINEQKIEVKMTEQQQQVYNQFKKDACIELLTEAKEKGRVTADVIISKIIKLHQITSGFVIDDEKNKQYITDEFNNPKLDALKLYIGDKITKPMIIWCHYRHDVEEVTKALQKKFGAWSTKRVYGRIPDQERVATLESFMNGETPFLVANPRSLGWGLTLTVADTAIYYSNHYNYEYKTQSKDRIHRLGQKAESVTYIDLVIPNTVDEEIYKALQEKKKFCNSMFTKHWLQDVLGAAVEVEGEVSDEHPAQYEE